MLHPDRFEMPRGRARLQIGIALIAVFNVAVSDPPNSAYLESRLDRMLEAPGVRSAFWGVHVVDVKTGEVLYDRNGDKRLLPASNLKILTTTTALDALSSEFRYQTVLYFKGTVEGNALVGDLIIRGSGDPSFGSARFRTDPLQQWAQQLAAAGVARFEGRIIGDDDVFEDAPYAEGWDVSLVATKAYAPSSGGLSYRDNLIDVLVRGRGNGAAPLVTESPVPHFTVENLATTQSGSGSGLSIQRLPGSTSLRLTGFIGSGQSRRLRIPVGNPTMYAVSAFSLYLRASGIDVDADVLDGDEVREGISYRGAEPLLAHISPPIERLIRLVNKNSNNFYAEQIFRSVGARGSTSAAERRVKDLLKRAGADFEALSMRDGSGLSRKDLVTPQTIAQLLAFMYRHQEWDSFTRSLPRGGERGTTLARRLSGVPVQAKTGSIEFTRALSGYVMTRDDRVLAFSIMANNYSVSGGRITGTVDSIVRTLAAYNGG